jgi:hypothetical protein
MPIPAPNGGSPSPESNPGPGGGFAAPAPAQTDPNAAAATEAVVSMVQKTRMIAEKYPQTVSKVKQINDLIAQIIQDIKGSQGPTEPKAPPV